MRLSVPAIAHTARNRLRDSSAARVIASVLHRCSRSSGISFWLASVAIQALDCGVKLLSRCSFCARARALSASNSYCLAALRTLGALPAAVVIHGRAHPARGRRRDSLPRRHVAAWVDSAGGRDLDKMAKGSSATSPQTSHSQQVMAGRAAAAAAGRAPRRYRNNRDASDAGRVSPRKRDHHLVAALVLGRQGALLGAGLATGAAPGRRAAGAHDRDGRALIELRRARSTRWWTSPRTSAPSSCWRCRGSQIMTWRRTVRNRLMEDLLVDLCDIEGSESCRRVLGPDDAAAAPRQRAVATRFGVEARRARLRSRAFLTCRGPLRPRRGRGAPPMVRRKTVPRLLG